MNNLSNAWIETLKGERSWDNDTIRKTLENFVNSALSEVYGEESLTSEQADERDQIITLVGSLFPHEVVDE